MVSVQLVHDVALVDWMLCDSAHDTEGWVFLSMDGEEEQRCEEEPVMVPVEPLESEQMVPATRATTRTRQIVISRELTRAIRRQQWRQRVAKGLELEGCFCEDCCCSSSSAAASSVASAAATAARGASSWQRQRR